jgi:hypothetical protein
MDLKRLFTEHPHAVGESYLQHMGVALSFSGPLFRAAFASLVHAVLPFLCVTTASRTIRTLHARIANRGAHVHRDIAVAPRREPSRDGLPVWDPVI